MGRATRWFKSLFTFKKDNNNNNNSNIRETPDAGMCHNPTTIPPNISPPTEAAWLRSYYTKTEKEEQSKHAIAVAAATAAAADAAIVAAQAAVAVVKLTGSSNGRGKTDIYTTLQSCRERYAAVRIQSVFRGYLARRALRALRSLVKIQAVVRGFLVRKQAAATLKCMQALVKAQATVRSLRVGGHRSRISGEFVSRKILDNIEIRSVHRRRFSSAFEVDERAKIVEMDMSSRPQPRPKSTSGRSSSLSIMNDQSHCCSTRLSPYARDFDWGLNGDECKYPTAHSTPKFSKRWTTPLNPSYMANTQSFRAKVRSHSAPKQRSSDGVMRRRVSLLEMMEARNSLSQASSVSFKSAVMRKMDRSSRDESGERSNSYGYYDNAVRR